MPARSPFRSPRTPRSRRQARSAPPRSPHRFARRRPGVAQRRNSATTSADANCPVTSCPHHCHVDATSASPAPRLRRGSRRPVRTPPRGHDRDASSQHGPRPLSGLELGNSTPSPWRRLRAARRAWRSARRPRTSASTTTQPSSAGLRGQVLQWHRSRSDLAMMTPMMPSTNRCRRCPPHWSMSKLIGRRLQALDAAVDRLAELIRAVGLPGVVPHVPLDPAERLRLNVPNAPEVAAMDGRPGACRAANRSIFPASGSKETVITV
ncbi:hypothetical protein DFJ66_3693 [Saccharothrix variisporea]|uniref:Uncharacterized protein n=2 Tax=Saccharothrix variisporea TaxID=543527 RepID=A0A495XCU9_9PSEU|nr:hypothetical protein DFJ66_3693 [Saccharothrix variisporea]